MYKFKVTLFLIASCLLTSLVKAGTNQAQVDNEKIASAYQANILSNLKKSFLTEASFNTDGSLYILNPKLKYRNEEYYIAYKEYGVWNPTSTADGICKIALSNKNAIAVDVENYSLNVEDGNCFTSQNTLFFDKSDSNYGLGNISSSLKKGALIYTQCRLDSNNRAEVQLYGRYGSYWQTLSGYAPIAKLTCIVK